MNINYARLYTQINLCVMGNAPELNLTNTQATHAFIEEIHKEETILVNGYKIRFNPIFKEWGTSHPDIGTTESFKILWDAIQYCDKG